MAIKYEELKHLLTSGFPNAEIELIDLAGDDNHYELRITSSEFSGKSKVDQHKRVYEVLGNIVGNELHALALKTYPKN
jgi:stress-induced morphogen